MYKPPVFTGGYDFCNQKTFPFVILVKEGGELIKLDEYETILIGFAREIVSYLQKSGASKAEAEDVVQDVFVKMLETDLVIPEDKMRAWMYRVSIDYGDRKSVV